MRAEAATVLIIGVGNPYRCDDGAGVAVARQLSGQGQPGIKVIEESGEGTALAEAWKGAPFVIVVDAIQSGAPLGSIRRLDVGVEKIPSEMFRRSTRAFGIAGAAN